MSKQSVRGFGIAVFLVGALIYSMNSLNIPLPGVDADAAAKKEMEELQKELATTQKQLDEAKSAKDDAVDEDEKGEDVIEKTIAIFRGNTAYDISRKLQDEGIIDNALQFELFLANGEYSRRIQIGEFTVSSDMTEEELAKALTTPTPLLENEEAAESDSETELDEELPTDEQDEEETNEVEAEEEPLNESQLTQP
ncbi:MAG: hypothetical protein UHX00_13220 [Caryophanon sp.]|nr:hypothetical protein [Caryophanon sp.]